MSGTAGVANLFASAVTATGAQLDANYSTIVAYINDPTNRNNYAVDTGSTNTVVLTFAPPLVGGYTTGLEICFKAANTNSGAMVVNANNLGNVNFVATGGAAFSSGQITLGGMYDAVYDGTQFVSIGVGQSGAATAAQVSAAVSLTTFVPPGRVQNHPGAAKAWGSITATYGILSSYNVASVGTAGTGTITINFTTAMQDTKYVALASGAAAGNFLITVSNRTTTACVVNIRNSTNGATQDSDFTFAIYGNQ